MADWLTTKETSVRINMALIGLPIKAETVLNGARHCWQQGVGRVAIISD